jgi:hypothetical protein
MFVLLIILVFMVYPPCFALSEEREPLSLDDIELLIKGNVSSKRIVKLVAEYGVSFVVTEDVVSKLKNSGANEVAIEAIKRASNGTLYIFPD